MINSSFTNTVGSDVEMLQPQVFVKGHEEVWADVATSDPAIFSVTHKEEECCGTWRWRLFMDWKVTICSIGVALHLFILATMPQVV